ncbi:hypothetical protein DAEQUDRAFT_722083 [Daedalea quercina L-15889]|uniref:Uncharacterized protein n=1 Tax=Daedalea quercina L-15889 TaxID=1314783 RepID=A0A165T6C8_9APHY|nr:hypothetical protein DAEQUDRAFT_722083 [Daedalea quercina L-15889]
MAGPTKPQLEAEIRQLKTRIVELEDHVANNEALRIAAEEHAAAKEDELQTMQAEAAAAAEQAAAAIAAANNQAPAAAGPPGTSNSVLIPKPRGSGGSTYKIRHAMGLADNKPLYARCMRVVRDLTLAAKINWQKDFIHQDPLVIGRLFHAAQERESYLARFESSWATGDLVKQFLRNRRKYGVRKGYVLPRAQRLAQAAGGSGGVDADD